MGRRRCTPDAEDVVRTAAAGQLVTAQVEDHLTGVVRVQRLGQDLAEFGMLAVDPDYRGTGLGSALVSYAEDWAVEQDISTMQLELLVPQTWTHPFKTFLVDWYTRIGYKYLRTGTLEEEYPALQPLLATPRHYVIYRRRLLS